MPKPGDFFLSLYEFFSILVPGALLLWLVATIMFEVFSPANAQDWALFLLLSYLIGHLLQLRADTIDQLIYDGVYVRGIKRPSSKGNARQSAFLFRFGDSTLR